MIKEILKDSESITNRAEEIDILGEDKTKISRCIKNLKDTLNSRDDLYALAAPQIGKNYRIFCLKFGNRDIRAFINPIITKTKDLKFGRDKSAGIPDKEFIVPYFDNILVMYQKPDGTNESNKLASQVFQTQMNILDGATLEDYGLEIIPEFDNASDEEKDQVIAMYIESLKNKGIQLQEDINNNPDLKRTQDAINYMTSVATGKTKLIHSLPNRAQRRLIAKMEKKISK